ncbi:MAG: alpha/beta hydrolase [Cyanobacteria bacterium SID2]|nr:alpha/beta hydrolase [Cyanobacteria bacterium SID2]MBP0002164.1 alpha/beta hydrolase [Cyanobacteria bacterium SBC]
MTRQTDFQLHVCVKGEGFPFLLLHGHPGASGSLSVFADYFCSRYRTIAPDLRGYGKSRPPGPFAMTDHLDDLEALLDRLQVDRCWVLGWSLGGILGLELALRSPERVVGLVGVATAACPRSSHPPVTAWDLAYTGIAGILNRFRPGWRWNIETFGKRSLFRYLVRRQEPSVYRYLAIEGVSAYLNTRPEATDALQEALREGYDRRDKLDRVRCPCLWLAGEADCHITRQSSRETALALPDCQWIAYPDTAHLFPWEIPEIVCSDIEAWLSARR